MIYDISGAAIPKGLPYAATIETACVEKNFPPCLAYAIAWRESISGETHGSWNACTVLSGDGGHGLFQLTSSYPEGWEDENINVRYALDNFLVPSLEQFAHRNVRGDALVLLVAAAFNSGDRAAWENYLAGNVDLGTTGNNYASAVLANFHRLILGQHPE